MVAIELAKPVCIEGLSVYARERIPAVIRSSDLGDQNLRFS